MAHFPKPFFRPRRDRWYVQLNGRQINLGAEKEEAFRRYHALMTERGRANPTPGDDSLPVVTALDLFLDWCKKHKALRTYEWYLEYLQSFTDSLHGSPTVADLRPFHVQQWLDAHPGWKAVRRSAIRSVQRALNWAVKFGHLTQNPVKGMEKPPQGSRDQVVSPEEYRRLLTQVRDEAFRDLLTVAWETGCRPQELRTVETRHFNETGRCWVFPPDEAKGKKRFRVIFLPDAAFGITLKLAARHAEGPLFRNRMGKPWTAYAINCRFGRLKKKLGVRYCFYAFRHTFCTRSLKNGVDAVTTARLMGHADLTMVSRVYAHVEKDLAHMQEAARRAANA